jgi:hypothetical protein
VAQTPRWVLVLSRLFAGDVFACVATFPWIVGTIPLVILRAGKEIVDLEGQDEKIQSIILHRLIAPAVVVFVAGHVPSFFWAFASDAREKRGRKVFFIGSAGWIVAGVLFAAGVWAWFWFGNPAI